MSSSPWLEAVGRVFIVGVARGRGYKRVSLGFLLPRLQRACSLELARFVSH